MTRARAIQIWFAAVLVAIAAGIVLGASVSGSTAVALLVLSLAPPTIILLVWPGAQSQTADDVIHDRRP
jgi:hypothetical protein